MRPPIVGCGSGVVVRPVVLLVPFGPLDALTVLADLALRALFVRSFGSGDVARPMEGRRGRGRIARGSDDRLTGFALAFGTPGFGIGREAAAFARVVDIDQFIGVAEDERFASGEEDIRGFGDFGSAFVGCEEVGIARAGAGGDQLDAARRPRTGSDGLGLILVDVFDATVGVKRRETIGAVEVEAAGVHQVAWLFAHSAQFLDPGQIGGPPRGFAGGVAGGTGEVAGGEVI